MVAGPADAAAILDGLREYEDEADLPSIPAFYRMFRKAVDAGWLVIEGIEPPSEGRGRVRPLLLRPSVQLCGGWSIHAPPAPSSRSMR